MPPVKRTRLEILLAADRRRFAGLVLRGETYPRRHELLEADGIYDPLCKGWLMPDVQTMLRLGAIPRDDDFYLPKPSSEDASHGTQDPQ